MCYFSARGISLTEGITDINAEVTALKREMMKHARQRVLLCDARKLDQISYCAVGPIDQVDCLITDRQPSAAWQQELNKKNVRLLYPGAKV